MRTRLLIAGVVTLLAVGAGLVALRVRHETTVGTADSSAAPPPLLRPGVQLAVPAGSETVVRVAGTGGDLLVASTERLYFARELELRGPDGEPLEPGITQGACFDQGVWLLPDDGEYELSYTPGGRDRTTLGIETATPRATSPGTAESFDLARRNQVVAVRVATGRRGFTVTARSSRAGGYVGGRNGGPLAALLVFAREGAYARRSDQYSMRERYSARGELGVTGRAVVASMACVNGPARLGLRVDPLTPRTERRRARGRG